MSEPASRLGSFLAELKRRKVYRVAVVYAVVAFLIWQAAEIAFPALAFPDWTLAFVIVLTFLGFPIALVLAWAFEITPEGVKRTEPLAEGVARAEPGSPAIRVAAGVAVFVLAIAAGWLVIRDGGPGPSADRKSIAVLPFANLSADPENEYFSDGITGDIINQLSKIADLRVTSRTSIMQYKRTEKSLREIGAELGVATVLEGEVQRAGDRVRINAQLIDARTDEHIWSEQYDRELMDIFAIQSDVAQQIAAALRARLSPAERERIGKEPTENLEAYNLYLQGRYFWNKRTEEGFWNAIEYFEGAIAIDSSYALGYAGLADCYQMLGLYAVVRPREVVPRAKAAALRALEIDSTLAEAHASLGFIESWHEFDWSEAEAQFERALELDPSYAMAHLWYGVLLTYTGRSDEALTEIRRALELDPLSPIAYLNLGSTLRDLGRYDEAIEQYQMALELDPDFWHAHWNLWVVYAARGMHEDAVAEMERLMASRGPGSLEPDHEEVEAFRRAYAVSGWTGALECRLQQLEEKAKERYVPPGYIAHTYALLGRNDGAFEWLERGIEEGQGAILGLMMRNPVAEGLRSDPRFTALLKRVGLPEE
ncbi:MAG: tetratricopeptide repeat protein, partial [Gemmatimonadota bacterium]